MNFMYALAGGAHEVGDAMSKDAKDKRDYKLDQQKEEANLLRKKNFARFGVDIQDQKDKNRSATALEEHEEKGNIDKAAVFYPVVIRHFVSLAQQVYCRTRSTGTVHEKFFQQRP